MAGRLEQHGVPVHVHHAAHLQARRGHDLGRAARSEQDQAAGVRLVPGPHDPAVRGPGRDARDDLQPDRVGVLVQHPGLAAGHVDAEDPHGPLVPALHHDQRVVPVLPSGGDQVRESSRAGGEPGGEPGGEQSRHRRGIAVEAGQDEGDVGVRGAGRGIGHLGGHPFGVRGIGDVPPGDRGLVHPRDEQRGAVRGPPVAAVAVHFLGRDELGQPERHPGRAARVRDRPVRKVAPQAGDPERAVADVGEPPSGRVGAGVQRRGPGRHLVSRAPLACTGAGERHRVHLAGQREDGHRDRLVGRVGHDPARLLPDPLAPGPLLRRQVVLVGAERPRVGDQAFLPARHVQRPQARHRVGAALGTQEDDPGAVGGDAERAGNPEAEPPRAGLLPGEALGHAMKSSQLGSLT